MLERSVSKLRAQSSKSQIYRYTENLADMRERWLLLSSERAWAFSPLSPEGRVFTFQAGAESVFVLSRPVEP